MINISQHIQAAEDRFRLPLEDFFKTEWGKTVLVSHDIEHHKRVWNFAAELLRESSGKYCDSGRSLAEGLIIACYLHDLGMSVDTGNRHGKMSRELCRKFLESNGLDESEYTDVLDAVENHDNKEYDGLTRRSDLATLLTVADDLDAFGYEGIYRYLEIYRERGIPDSEIPARILDNAAKRFLYFETHFKDNSGLVERHRKRFNILVNFFRQPGNK